MKARERRDKRAKSAAPNTRINNEMPKAPKHATTSIELEYTNPKDEGSYRICCVSIKGNAVWNIEDETPLSTFTDNNGHKQARERSSAEERISRTMDDSLPADWTAGGIGLGRKASEMTTEIKEPCVQMF